MKARIKKAINDANVFITKAIDKGELGYIDWDSTIEGSIDFENSKPITIKNQFVYIEFTELFDGVQKHRFNTNKEEHIDELIYILRHLKRAAKDSLNNK